MYINKVDICVEKSINVYHTAIEIIETDFQAVLEQWRDR